MFGRQIGILFLNVFISLVSHQADPPVNRPHSAPGLDGDCHEIQLSVRGIEGRPIRDALVVVNDSMHFFSDTQGRVVVGCRPDLRLPLYVEAGAEGFQTRRMLVPRTNGREIEIILSRGSEIPAPSRDSVSISELSPDVQEESLHLQQEGLDAIHRGDYDRADALFQRALVLTPSSPSIYNNLGVACARRRDVAQAAHWFEKAFHLAPFDSTTEGNLGVIRWAQNRCEESYRLIKASVGRGYSSPGAYYALGVMELQRGLPGEAVKHLSKAKSKEFAYRDLYLYLALAQLNKANAALKSYQRFRRSRPVSSITAAYGSP